MNKQKFVDLLRNPEQISTSELSELETIAKENPYFQSGHIVIARASRVLKTPKSARKINTAAIYATNRNTLKSYMQGNAIASPPKPKKTVSPVKETLVPTPITKAPVPRKAPQLLNKTDHDILIDDIYANLDNWKKSRDQFLDYEKLSDELELSTKKDEIDDAVEKIKSQIAEEVIAEDKVLKDQLEKIEVVHEVEETLTPVIDEIQEDDIVESKVEESVESNLEIDEIPVIEKNKGGTDENIKEEPVSEENFNATDYLKSLRKDEKEEELKKDDLAENIDTTSNDQSTTESPKIEDVSINESIEKHEDEPIAAVPKETEVPTPPVEKLEVEDNELTSKLIDDEIERGEQEVEASAEAQISSDEIVEPVNEIIDTADTKSSIEDEAKDELNPLSTSGKSNKKFRLSVLNRRKGKIPLSKKKSILKSDSTPNDSKSDASSTEKSEDVKKKVETESPEKKKTKLKPLKEKIINQSALIDSFLESNPTIKVNKDKPESEIVDLSVSSSEFPKEAITENLAKILVNQNKSDAAIKVYQKLIIQEPDKEILYQSKINDLESETSSAGNDTKNEDDLLLKFTEENPSIFVSNWNELSELALELSKDISSLPEEQVTESLAKVLTHHKLFKQSILIYERLSLIYPEKIAYFASQIEKLKNK